MRTGHGLLLTLLAVLPATRAGAQAVAPADPGAALTSAVFVAKPLSAQPAADGGVFAVPVYAGSALGPAGLGGQPRLVEGQGLAVWRTGEISTPAAGGAVDSLRLSVGEVAWTPGGVISARPADAAQMDAQAFDVSYVRGWPSAFSVSAGGYDLAVSPHAGLGMTSAGGSAEAGAMVQLGARLKDEVTDRLEKLGVRQVDGASFGGRGHWYLFAAASGRAVGLNMVSDRFGQLQRAGWSAEGASALIGDAQAGLGWRQGQVQAAFGYIHREIRQFAPVTAGPVGTGVSDSMVAFSLTVRPR
jgi:hypothetical protein